MIRHAAPRPVRALAVAVVETSLDAALMARPGGAHRPHASGPAAGRRAVGVSAVARRADGEPPPALSAGPLTERLIHDVGARNAISDWTTSRSRGTKEPAGLVCRSSGRSRGSGGQDRTLTLRPGPLDAYMGCSGAEDGMLEEAPAALRVAARFLAVSGLGSRRFTVAMRTFPYPAKGRRASRQTPRAHLQGPAYSLRDGGLVFRGQPGVTDCARQCLPRPS